jgi:hypothetical protein
MTQLKNVDPTQYISFMKEDATIIWIKRDAIIYFYKDTATYKTTVKLMNGEVFVVSEKVDDVQNKCNMGN